MGSLRSAAVQWPMRLIQIPHGPFQLLLSPGCIYTHLYSFTGISTGFSGVIAEVQSQVAIADCVINSIELILHLTMELSDALNIDTLASHLGLEIPCLCQDLYYIHIQLYSSV